MNTNQTRKPRRKDGTFTRGNQAARLDPSERRVLFTQTRVERETLAWFAARAKAHGGAGRLPDAIAREDRPV